jgi:hypothetical protein
MLINVEVKIASLNRMCWCDAIRHIPHHKKWSRRVTSTRFSYNMKDVPPPVGFWQSSYRQHKKYCALKRCDTSSHALSCECNAAAKHQILLFDASSLSTDSSFEERTKQLARN